MPEPWPAPAWIRTRWPKRCSSSTPTGVMATRDSCVLISLGTPTTYLSPFGIADHPFPPNRPPLPHRAAGPDRSADLVELLEIRQVHAEDGEHDQAADQHPDGIARRLGQDREAPAGLFLVVPRLLL